MLAKTGLVIVTNPKQIGNILSSVQKQVKNTLYIQLVSALTDSSINFHPNIYNSWPKYSSTIHRIYSQAAYHCYNLDVKVLLSGLKYNNVTKIQTQDEIDLVIFDKVHNCSDIEQFLSGKIANIKKECETVTLDAGNLDEVKTEIIEDERIYKHAVLGGTFDRLHAAHKLLLSEAALRSNYKVTVGVTEENMLFSKILWELIEPISTRVNTVKKFLLDICPELEVNVVPITDAFGPTQNDPTMELLIVSAETIKGGEKVNEVRKSKGLQPLDVIPVQIIDEPYPQPNEETKISSSTSRIRLLGTPLKPVEENKNIPKKPYVIGLTGGIASGKSGIAKHLSNLGAQVIDCDKLAHNLYKAGKPCYTAVVETFGNSVVDEDGEINRKILGSIVFKNPTDMEKLNSIIWPALAGEVNNIVRNSSSEVIVVEAAILLKAGWQEYCHEIWTTIIPRDEAINRLQNRNNLTREQAIARINSQSDNCFYVKESHVIFCSLWSVEFTKGQVKKAWSLLQKRIG